MRVHAGLWKITGLVAALGLAAGCSSGQGGDSASRVAAAVPALKPLASNLRRACDQPAAPGYARCHAIMRTDIVQPMALNGTPSGFGPADLVAAYNLPATGGAGKTVAVVDANDYPNAESDLAVYRQQYGLPPCTTANGCFKKVNQDGATSSFPSEDDGWSGEMALDLDMISAVCPSCNIVLVEANTATMADLGAAVNTAAKLGAVAISNSYGGPEDSTAASTDASYFNHPGVTITVSSGDGGYGINYPASSQYVIAIGGTSLTKDSSTRGWSESAWSGSGSGCSANVAALPFQKVQGCSFRAVADIAAVADPATGVASYCTQGSNPGWQQVGGTSVASPLMAGIFTLTGIAGVDNSYPYSHVNAFNNVTTGSNGTCDNAVLCNAGAGWNGPTGLGTPNGAAL